ncbi:MAG TPA: hypothetical protein VF068_07750 [Rubrobacter sp.]
MTLLVKQRPYTTFISYWARLLAVVLLVLAAASPLAGWQIHTESIQGTVVSAVAGSGESGFSSVISTSEASEENTDPTDLGTEFGVVCISFLMVCSTGLLSAFHEVSAKVSFDFCSALEQPG